MTRRRDAHTRTRTVDSSFEGADLTDADLSDAYLGDFELKAICKNPTLQGTNPVTGLVESRCAQKPCPQPPRPQTPDPNP